MVPGMSSETVRSETGIPNIRGSVGRARLQTRIQPGSGPSLSDVEDALSGFMFGIVFADDLGIKSVNFDQTISRTLTKFA